MARGIGASEDRAARAFDRSWLESLTLDPQHFLDVLVAAAGEVDDHASALSTRAPREHPGDRVRALERGQDALGAGAARTRRALPRRSRNVGRGPDRRARRARGRPRDSRDRPTPSASRASGRARPGARASRCRAARPARRSTKRAACSPVAIPRPRPRRRPARTLRVVEERVEEADGVAAAADAGDQQRRAAARRAPRICSRASSPMTRWKSRTIVGNGCGPSTEPRM